jgi:hypothetical protein
VAGCDVVIADPPRQGLDLPPRSPPRRPPGHLRQLRQRDVRRSGPRAAARQRAAPARAARLRALPANPPPRDARTVHARGYPTALQAVEPCSGP